jgi:hypothetical protein
MIMSFGVLKATEERLGIATGRPLVAYLVLLLCRVFHSTRQGSEASAP